MKNLTTLLQRLADAKFDFVIVGGFAAVLHGSSYVTDDLGIGAVLSSENIEKLRRALADLKPVHRLTHSKLSFLDYPAPGQPVANLYLETDAGTVDVPGHVLGIGDYAALAAQAIEIPLFSRRCRVISAEGLIRAKEAVGREKDLLTAKELRAILAKRSRG
jgi:hypothetical protein